MRYRLIGFLIRNWLLPSYMVTDQKALTGGCSPPAKAAAGTGEFGANVFGLRIRRDVLEGSVQILEEVRFDPRSGGRKQVGLRRGGRCGLFQERRERLDLISGLNLLHVRHICRIEELS